ncbi:thymidylate synthase [Bombiscardovia apis]|uniref:Thymidylate synthase n=1 Tax=Bombiscardovia apis TaxID=2932182 RepID=A0ABN6SGP0_9BIFI|nr:YigZ family protein [Bombiscardovia apis]BDR55170.1 thymidylate synthase [Bombiscardovia apis]
MRTVLDSPGQPAVGELEERKSVFIGAACHISSEAEALAFLEEQREANPKARHVCHCAIWGGDSVGPDAQEPTDSADTDGLDAQPSPTNSGSGTLSEHMSDDGEPSGTAGKPILEVLRRNDMTDCIVTVTRYFGGILLGSGGLIRAYSSAASLALKAARQAQIVPARRLLVRVDYPRYERLKQLVERCRGQVSNEEFTDQVTLTIDLASDQTEAFTAELTNLFNGQVSAQDRGSTAFYQATES